MAINEADWLEQALAIARNGLHYSDGPWEQERYQRLMDLCLAGYEALSGQDRAQFAARLLADAGQVTPKLGTDAAIFNDAGEILLMDRADGSGWCLPGGWVEAGERPRDTVVREAFEETGLVVEVVRLVGVISRPAGTFGNVHSMSAIVHLCRVVGGELTLSHEGRALKYQSVDAVTDWHANHRDYAVAALACHRDPDFTVVNA